MTIGDRLREKRRQRGISAAELGRRAAEIMGRQHPISASAVRNQENGTNGVPLALASVYAGILNVPLSWLVEGDRPLPAIPEVDELAIAVFGPLSGDWSTVTLTPPAHRPRAIFVEVTGFAGISLNAQFVEDGSLVPVYPAGTAVCHVPLSQTRLREGDHVLVHTTLHGSAVECLREVRSDGKTVRLLGIGSKEHPPIDLIRAGKWVSDVAIVSVVVAAVRGRVNGPELALPENTS